MSKESSQYAKIKRLALTAVTSTGLALGTQACNRGPEISISNPEAFQEADIYHRGVVEVVDNCTQLVDGRREKVKFGKLDSLGNECVGAVKLTSREDDIQLYVNSVSYFRQLDGKLKARVITVDGQEVLMDAVTTYGGDFFILDGFGREYEVKPNAEDGESIIGESYIQKDVPSIDENRSDIVTIKAEDAAATTEPEQVAPLTAPATEEVAPQPTVAIVTEPIDNGYPLDLPEPTAILKQVVAEEKDSSLDPYDCIESHGESAKLFVPYGENNRWMCTGKGINPDGHAYFNFIDFQNKDEFSVIYDMATQRVLGIEQGKSGR